jgi:SAM-dependent methyltransferase
MKAIKNMVNSYLKRVNKNLDSFIDKNNWSNLDNSFKKRKYSSYDDYVSHQKSKLKTKEKSLKNNHNHHVERFYQRFHNCEYIKMNSNVLCLGARTGAEVEAFRKLGCFAVGIDLNPGIDNPFVMYGDFHNILFPKDSIDIIYCNCLDHLFNLDEVLKEIIRVLKNEGGGYLY